MEIVNIHAAKTHLSKLIEKACSGEEIVIARNSEPVVRLVPVHRPEPQREFGALRGRLAIPEEFFEPLPDDELDAWEQ
jgi:prevent-host-death family protein